MPKLIVAEQISLDGVVQSPGGPQEDPSGIADLFNSVLKHVATHRFDSLDWQNSHALEGDLPDAIRALKRQWRTRPARLAAC